MCNPRVWSIEDLESHSIFFFVPLTTEKSTKILVLTPRAFIIRDISKENSTAREAEAASFLVDEVKIKLKERAMRHTER